MNPELVAIVLLGIGNVAFGTALALAIWDARFYRKVFAEAMEGWQDSVKGLFSAARLVDAAEQNFSTYEKILAAHKEAGCALEEKEDGEAMTHD